MRLALAQTNIIWEDKQANLTRVEAYLASTDAEIVLFPEMSLTGFSMHTDETAEPAYSWTVTHIAALAKKYQKTIGIGWVKEASPLCENHYSIVTAQGAVAMDFAKLHPFSYSGEDQHFQGGTKLVVGMLGGFCTGFAICYDLRFPEQFRAMLPEAELFVVPANWPEARAAHWKTLLAARAIENQCYVAGINCCGDMDGQYYSGDSGVYAPDGTLLVPKKEIRLADAACREEKLLVYDINNDVKKIRDAFPVWKDYKPIEHLK